MKICEIGETNIPADTILMYAFTLTTQEVTDEIPGEQKRVQVSHPL